MKFPVIQSVAAVALSLSALSAYAADANVTNNVITGNGIANGGFTIGNGGGVEVGLRARERHDLATNSPTNVTGSNNNGTYTRTLASLPDSAVPGKTVRAGTSTGRSTPVLPMSAPTRTASVWTSTRVLAPISRPSTRSRV
jgi:hypothetical protein